MEFTFVNILSFVLLAFAIFIAYRIYRYMQTSKQTLEDLLINKSTVVFKLIQTASTGIEVVGLSLMAMNRGITPFNAFSRYLLIGFAEALLTVLFLIVLEQSLRKAVKDGIITLGEIITTVIKSSIFFLLAFFMTGQIYMMYLESINQVEFQQPTFLTALIPILGSYVETDINLFTDAMVNAEGFIIQERIEYGAIVMIFVTPLFNLISLPFVIREVCKGSKVALWRGRNKKGGDSKKDDQKAERAPFTGDPVATKEQSLFNRLAKILTSHSGEQLYKTYKALCGIEQHATVKKHSSITDNATLQRFQENAVKVLTGVGTLSSPEGIEGFENLQSEIDKIKKGQEYKDIVKDLASVKNLISTESDNLKLNSLKAEERKHEQKQLELDNKIKKYEDSIKKIREDVEKFARQIGLI